MRAEELRGSRERANLTQTELAQRTGIAQPNISAYESGRRVISTSAARALRSGLRPLPGQVLESRAREVRETARRFGLRNVRVFGSARWGTDQPGSDIDLLVHVDDDADAYAIVHAATALSEVLDGLGVDLVSDAASGAVMERIRADAVPL